MAFDPRGLVGRPSLRRALGAMSSEQQDQFSAVTADIDPTRFRSLYKQRANDFLNQQRELAAQRAPGVREQMRQQMQDAQTDRNFRAGDTGAVDYAAEDKVKQVRRRLSLLRSV